MQNPKVEEFMTWGEKERLRAGADKISAPVGIPILTQTFPLGSVYTFEQVYIRPINFAGFLYYGRNFPRNADEFTIFLYIYNFVSMFVDKLPHLFLPDIYYAFYLFWGISINKDMEFVLNTECVECGKNHSFKVHMSDVKFKKIESPLFSITVGGKEYQCKYPTGEFISTHLPQLVRMLRGNVPDLDTAFLILSVIGFERDPMGIADMIINAEHDDILSVFDAMINCIAIPVEDKTYVCTGCGHKNKVNYYGALAKDFFRIFMENRGLNQAKNKSK